MKRFLLCLGLFLFSISAYSQFEKDKLHLILPHAYFSKPNKSYIGEKYAISYQVSIFNHYIAYCIYDVNNYKFIYSGIITYSIEDNQGFPELTLNNGTFTDAFIDEFFADTNKLIVDTAAYGFFYRDRSYALTADAELNHLKIINLLDTTDITNADIPELKKVLVDAKDRGGISISNDKKQIAFYTKKRIFVYDIKSKEMLWASRKVNFHNKNEFLLLNSNTIITSLPVKKQKHKFVYWYDFKNESIIFSTKSYQLNTFSDEFQAYNHLVLIYGDVDQKKPTSSSYIDLSTGKFSDIQNVKWKNRYDLSWYVTDSIVKKAISQYEFENYFENYTQYPNWRGLLGFFYKIEQDTITETKQDTITETEQDDITETEQDDITETEQNDIVEKQVIKKVKLTPMTVDTEFFTENGYFDEVNYRNYQIISTYYNKVTYKDISRDIKMYKIYALNKEILFWNGNQNLKDNRIVRLIVSAEGIPIFLTKDNYYFSTKQAKNIIAFFLNGKRYSFEQFDLKYNRPDIVLSRLGYASQELIDAYYKAYQKRIKKMGFTEEQLSGEFHIPETKIENFEYMPVIEEKEIDLNLNFNDSKYNLDRYNIWINEVPVYGIKGKSLKGFNNSSYSVKEKVLLSEGRNKIQVSCLNEKGAESYKETVEITCSPNVPETQKLYFIGIGVDKYSEKGHDLKYSVKDIRDLTSKLKEKYGNNFSVDTLFNDNVTKENVLALKEKLLQTDINDKVIISFSGHGLLSSTYDYYLGTYNTNFSKPENGGLPYDDMEWLLDSIPARMKLLLIDACHSGEVDKDEMVTMNNTNKSEELKGAELQYAYEPTLGMKNSFELMQELFTNVNRGTGATIISAASGTQYALERGDLRNGVFTYCIIELMQQNKEMKVSKLKELVGKRVEELTNGLQKPTSRNENLENDWRVW